MNVAENVWVAVSYVSRRFEISEERESGWVGPSDDLRIKGRGPNDFKYLCTSLMQSGVCV